MADPKPIKYSRARKSFQERFWAKVDIRGLDDCWEWNASRRCGYGQINRGKRGDGGMIPAHRASWEINNGPIPDGQHVLHRCDNRPCCNPTHLFLGTNDDNIADMITKGRNAHGSQSGSAKLAEEDVSEIHRLRVLGWSQDRLADQYRVHQTTIWAIFNGKSWRNHAQS